MLGADYRDNKKGLEVGEDELGRIGEAATHAGRACIPAAGSSAFGPTGREARRKKLRQLCNGVVGTSNDYNKEEAALVLADKLTSLGVTVSTSLAAARGAQRQRTLDDKQRMVRQDEALAKYRAGIGAEAVNDFLAKHPCLPTIGCFDPVPSPRGLLVEVRPAAAHVVGNAVAWAAKSKESNASACMKECWEAMHATLPERNSPACSAPAMQPSVCWTAGRCICSPEGRALNSLRGSFLKRMSRAFPPRSPERALLVGGDIVLRLRGSPDPEDMEALVNLDQPFPVVWLHVGLMYLCPFRPTFSELVPVPSDEDERSGQEVAHLKARLSPRVLRGLYI